MKTVTFALSSAEEVTRRAKAAFRGEKQGARISFASPELLFSLMTPKRWELIRAMAGAGPMSIRESARRIERDVKAVHGDVHALLDAGVLQRSDDGLVLFPFDAIHVDFVLRGLRSLRTASRSAPSRPRDEARPPNRTVRRRTSTRRARAPATARRPTTP